MQSTKKLLELVSLAVLLDTSSVYKNSETEINKLFTVTSKHMNYLKINLTIQAQDLYIENYKTLLRENNGGLSKCRKRPCLWVRKFSFVNTSIFSKMICRFKASQMKISAGYFVEIDKLILKFIWKCKELRIVSATWKKNGVGELTLPDFKIYYRPVVVNKVSQWYQDGCVD